MSEQPGSVPVSIPRPQSLGPSASCSAKRLPGHHFVCLVTTEALWGEEKALQLGEESDMGAQSLRNYRMLSWHPLNPHYLHLGPLPLSLFTSLQEHNLFMSQINKPIQMGMLLNLLKSVSTLLLTIPAKTQACHTYETWWPTHFLS